MKSLNFCKTMSFWKIIASSFLSFSAFFGLSSIAHAELQSRLNGQAVYDTDLDITWIADAGTRLRFSAAKQWVANLSVDGVTGWRLPDAKRTFNGTSYSLSEMGHLFYKELGGDALPYPPNILDNTDPDLALFMNTNRIYYWTEDSVNNRAVAYSFWRGFQVQTYRTYRSYGVWAVHDGDVGVTVPDCTVNCLRVDNFTLTNASTELRSTIRFADENGSATGARNAVVQVRWERPDGTTQDDSALIGTPLSVSFTLPITVSGTYTLRVLDAVKTGYRYDPNNSVVTFKTLANVFPPNTAKLGDVVWEDTNEDGFLDYNERGLASVSVNLLSCNSSNILQSTTTSQSGRYSFSNLASGSYQVQFIAPTGFHFSPQHAGTNPLRDSDANASTGKTSCISVSNGDTKLDIDAGVIQNGSGPEPIVDVVTVTKAVYKRKRRRLSIKANSDALPRGSAVITATMMVNGVETQLGTLRWYARKGYYKGKFTNIRVTPDSVKLTSDQGGSVTKSVTVK